jgi:hypothetical protein
VTAKVLCYIDAMIGKSFVITAAFFCVLAPSALIAQTAKPAKPSPAAPAHGAAASTPAAATPSPAPADSSAPCEGAACDTPPSHITIATPAPAPAPWPWQDRISWAAAIVLTLFAYVGIMLGVSALRKIERQLVINESAVVAATESSKAALAYVQAQVQAERPWLLVTAEPAPGAIDSFAVMATNRGRSPARVTALSDGIAFIKDESQLSGAAVYKSGQPRIPIAAMILLPGESAVIKTFRREDVKAVCDSPEHLQRVESWDEKIYLLGTVTYIDLRPSEESQSHQTTWCSWYIHGRQKSGLVMAGSPEFNQHT